MKFLKKIFFSFLVISFSLGASWGDDFVPLNNQLDSGFELRDSFIDLDIHSSNIIHQDSFFSSNSCSQVNLSRNYLFLSPKISFSYCLPTWLVLSFSVPSDWEPGTNMFIDLHWFSLDNSLLGTANYKTFTNWKIFYKSIDDKVISSFDNSTPNTLDQAILNLIDSLKSFRSVNFNSLTPTNSNSLVSTGKNLIIDPSVINLNGRIVIVIYREPTGQEDKFYPAINLQSARVIYTKKHIN